MKTENSTPLPEAAVMGGRNKCLSGISLMIVDDSRSVAESVRLMAIKSGARLRRADCVTSAKKHLNIFRPDVVIIDLALPDGNGVDLAKDIALTLDPKPAVILLSGADEESISVAKDAAGAEAYLTKPIVNMRSFQEAILGVLPEERSAKPDRMGGYRPAIIDSEAYLLDLENMQDLLKEALESNSVVNMKFCAQFLTGVAETVGDTELSNSAKLMDRALTISKIPKDQAAKVLKIVSDRINQPWAAAS